ncbi:wax ester/triacylglycerol synthase family O-acyltransferase [Rhodococcus sp. H29-C3]|uniref:WS/DGAT/MGAT family O-acyltransferase n=1 Tax=Rhodococcus sp. H29-C3 TaxID=3046307 RepID=UPI0024B97EE7|nr:wax ester/triacylglycerol synthase family O-acyltransferase [Rhodococcus sp. H29-C3]MDJ0358757.1 wax ester/triacylglycerol synthase family O-acyltransferase [Rhodococcus sp. H29-C3]
MERLSGLDASFLYLETPEQPLNVCGLIELEAVGDDVDYDADALKVELLRRLEGIPTLRKKLHDSVFNLDHPVWVEDENFDIDKHFYRMTLPAPAGKDEVAAACAHFSVQPLDRSRPLWEMWVLEGAKNGKTPIFLKMHHSTVDGISAANIISLLCSIDRDAEPLPPSPGVGSVNNFDLAVGSAVSFASRPLQALSILPATVRTLTGWIGRARSGRAMPPPFVAPRTQFNGTLSRHRSVAFEQLKLSDVKEIKNAFDAKVNDVVLAMCAGAIRIYLEKSDGLPEDSLIAVVPVSVHEKSSRPGTNQVSAMFASLATDIDDPVERLLAISASHEVGKEHNREIGATLLQDWAQFASPATFAAAMRAYAALDLAQHHPVVHNLVMSNVPGPPMPLYFLGAKVTGMFPLGPILHGAGLNITVMSGDGRLDIGLIADREQTPDLDRLADAMGESLAELLEAAQTRTKES